MSLTLAAPLQRPEPPSQYAAVLSSLRDLSRKHLLAWRIEVGSLLIDEFFGGQAALYFDRDSHKVMSFHAFLDSCADELAAYGLSETGLRDSIRARQVFQTLPLAAQQHLEFSHLTALMQVSDPSLRSRLALAAVDGRWSVRAMKAAVRAARQGRWYDADPETPGTQPPEPQPLLAVVVSVARLVTRTEKLVPQMQDCLATWQLAAAGGMSAAQRQRLDAVLETLAVQVAALRKLARR